MGVQGLWQLLHPAGKPVSPSSLEGKVLAVDVSIWLHQTLKGMRDKDGNPLPNAHLQGLFSRICKLLFYRIRPVFVFDGGAPALKKQTLAARRERKELVDKAKGRTNQKLLENLLRTHAVSGALGERTAQIDVPSKNQTEPDIFQLPPLPEVDKGSGDPLENAAEWEAELDREESHRRRTHLDVYRTVEDNLQNLDEVDFDSPEFEALPPEIKHEILTEMKEQRKERALARFVVMPEESEDFSSFQLKKLIKQSKLSGKIESLRKEMNERASGDITYALGDDYYGEVVEARRVVSEDASHYILIKGLTRKQQMAEAEKCKAERIFGEFLSEDMKQTDKTEPTQKGKSSRKRVKFEDEQQGTEGEDSIGYDIGNDVNSDTDVGGGQKTATDLWSSDDEETMTRRRTRGKALLKKNKSGADGENLAAKNRKGKFRPRSKKVVISDEDSDDLLEQSKPAAIHSKSSHESAKPKSADDDCVEENLLVTHKVSADENNQMDHDKVIDLQTVNEEHDFDETRQKLISEEEQLGREREAKMAALMKSLEKRTGQSEEVLPSADVQEDELSTKVAIQELLQEEEDLAKQKESKMAALMKSLEKRTELSAKVSPGDDVQEDEAATIMTSQELLQEEEDLAKQKESKMAALMKSLEKRTELSAKVSPGDDVQEDEAATIMTSQELLQEEEKLAKEKESKMAALRESLEKRSKLQAAHSSDDHADAATSDGNPEDSVCRDSSEKSTGFLEDIVQAEQRIVQRKSKTRVKVKTEAAPSSSASETVMPDMTLEYLEDVDGMLAGQSDLSAEPTENTGHSEITRLKPGMTVEYLENMDAADTKSRIDSEQSLPNNPKKRKYKPEEDISAVEGGDALYRKGQQTLPVKKTKTDGETEGETAEKQARVSRAEASAGDTNESEDEGFIEITVDPSKIQEDDLFPASLFVIDPKPSSSSTSPQDGKARHDDTISDNDSEVQIVKEDAVVRESLLSQKQAVGVKSIDVEESDETLAETDEPRTDSERDASMLHPGEEGKARFQKKVDSLVDLYSMQRELVSERRTLTTERGRQARLGKSITEQINLEAQELLQLFGIPYVVSPMEAESQCAYLELAGLTQGTITDDSDAWLFGAQNIYKNFFNQTKYVEFYTANAVQQRFGLDRRKLINVALLCGSDYTPGIPGVGPVRAMEILAEFPGEGLEGLQAFREWWACARAGLVTHGQGKIKNKLKDLELHEGFPSGQVVDAYLHPAVDESEETFTWGSPDVDLLRQYAKDKFGWTRQKADDTLLPMMKEWTKSMAQGRIHSYFQPENFLRPKPVQSKRLQRALDKFQGNNTSSGSESESESESESASGSEPELPTMGLPNPGEGIIAKANKILGGSPTGRGRGKAHRGRKSDRGGKSDNLQPEVKGQSGRGRGKRAEPQVSSQRGRGRGKISAARRGQKSAVLTAKCVLKDEVSLSESSSSDESSGARKEHQSKTVKSKKGPSRKAEVQQPSLPRMQLKTGKSATARAKSVKKTKRGAGDVPVNSKVTAAKREQKANEQKVQLKPGSGEVSASEAAAFKAALGLDLCTMTADDLGSDFSEEDIHS